MPKRSSKNPDRGDENESAFNVVREAIEGEPTGPDVLADLIREVREAPDAAAEFGSTGGKKGGPARAKRLRPERRTEIARKAARTRWADRASEEQGS